VDDNDPVGTPTFEELMSYAIAMYLADGEGAGPALTVKTPCGCIWTIAVTVVEQDASQCDVAEEEPARPNLYLVKPDNVRH